MAGRVLVVEDNEKSMKLFRDVLEASGYTTLAARTGEEAVTLAQAELPALVLMDVQLPGIDGIGALARLREDARTAAIPVVVEQATQLVANAPEYLRDDAKAFAGAEAVFDSDPAQNGAVLRLMYMLGPEGKLLVMPSFKGPGQADFESSGREIWTKAK